MLPLNASLDQREMTNSAGAIPIRFFLQRCVDHGKLLVLFRLFIQHLQSKLYVDFRLLLSENNFSKQGFPIVHKM